MVVQVVPLLTMEDHSIADIHTAAHGGLHAAAGGHALNEPGALRRDPVLEQGKRMRRKEQQRCSVLN